VFFKSDDPDSLKEWYNRHLGIAAGKFGAQWQWRKEKAGNGPGFTVWSPFESSTSYFDPSDQSYMINYRVNDLEALLARLKEQHILQVGEVEIYEYGKFAWIMDPEGRKIELWQPDDDEYLKMDGDTMAAE
jgi:predicted enzyme related to lactoylglutathione lyase